jgi:hypothetical protein
MLSLTVFQQEREKLEAVLGKEYTRRIVRAEELPLEYVETRLPEMMPTYRNMMEVVHSLISRAFSNEVIKPGTTTNEDVVLVVAATTQQQQARHMVSTFGACTA